MSPKNLNLKNKLDDAELDLSMMRLTDIPVSEIATIPKATKIDLSNNELVTVPHSFAKCLIHVTKIDLNSNKLRELPNNFGNLVNLKHLDLYNNQLTELPLTLSNLQNLRYIDVKNNPLKPDLAKVAGNCLNNKECQAAAKNLIVYLKKLRSEKDRQVNLKALKEKERDMARQRQEEEEKAKERERKKAEKKAAKEKKRLEIQEAKQTTNQNGTVVQNGKPPKKEVEKKAPVVHREAKVVKKSLNSDSLTSHCWAKNKMGMIWNKWSLLGLLNIFLVFGVLITTGICVALYAEGDLSVEGLKAAWPRAKRNSILLFNMTKEALKSDNIKRSAESVWKTLGPFALKVQDALILSYNTTKNIAKNFFGNSSPYVEGLKPLWNKFVSNVTWLSGLALDSLSKIDWSSILGGVRWSGEFIADQVRVLNAEFWRNEAILSAWEDLKPFRDFVWENTDTIRRILWQVFTDFQTSWYPVIKEECYNLYFYGKKSIESLLT